MVKVLVGMGVVYLLEPYANNALKRLVKTPKFYFCDTGLAAHLSRWRTAEVLMEGARLHPLEMKKTACPKRPASGFAALEKVEGFEVSDGGVICMVEAPRPIGERFCAIPSNII